MYHWKKQMTFFNILKCINKNTFLLKKKKMLAIILPHKSKTDIKIEMFLFSRNLGFGCFIDIAPKCPASHNLIVFCFITHRYICNKYAGEFKIPDVKNWCLLHELKMNNTLKKIQLGAFWFVFKILVPGISIWKTSILAQKIDE